MAGHGWVTENPNGMKARCGGPAICDDCKQEYIAKYGKDAWDRAYLLPSAEPVVLQPEDRTFTRLVEVVARSIHESGRKAVENGLVLNKPEKPQPFLDFDELPVAAQAGRRSQAIQLLLGEQLIPENPNGPPSRIDLNHHGLNDQQQTMVTATRKMFQSIQHLIEMLPSGRSQSLALTHLEESCMHSIKAIALNPEKLKTQY